MQKDYLLATATIPTEISTYATPSVVLGEKKTNKGKGKDKPPHCGLDIFGADLFQSARKPADNSSNNNIEKPMFLRDKH